MRRKFRAVDPSSARSTTLYGVDTALPKVTSTSPPHLVPPLTLRQRILASTSSRSRSSPAPVLSGRLSQPPTQARIDQAGRGGDDRPYDSAVPDERRQAILVRLGQDSGTRLRVYHRPAQAGRQLDGAPPPTRCATPPESPGIGSSPGARQWLDAIVVLPPTRICAAGGRRPFRLAGSADRARDRDPVNELRRAPDGTPYVSAAIGSARIRCCCSP